VRKASASVEVTTGGDTKKAGVLSPARWLSVLGGGRRQCRSPLFRKGGFMFALARLSASTASNRRRRSLKRDAMGEWRRFVSCVQALPENQAAPLWLSSAAGSRLPRLF
jgi:hypothetical protein